MEFGVVRRSFEKEVFNNQVAGHTGDEKTQQQDDFREDANLKLGVVNPSFVSWNGHIDAMLL